MITASKVFSQSKCLLGEGLYIDPKKARVFWLDIEQSIVFEKSILSDNFMNYQLDDNPSAILNVNNSEIFLADQRGVASYDLLSKEKKYISKNKDLISEKMRSNDGVMLHNNIYIYGTMEKCQQKLPGNIYLVSNNTKNLNSPNFIPNSFIVIDETEILITDSKTQITKLFKYNEVEKTLTFVCNWFDFSSIQGIPDGGCVSSSGNIYICLWDGAGIAKLSKDGVLLDIIKVPVLRPTNCKIYENKLFYTSAQIGLSSEELELYPLSGSVLIIESDDL